jgi:filamentous hemagglutinin family protein
VQGAVIRVQKGERGNIMDMFKSLQHATKPFGAALLLLACLAGASHAEVVLDGTLGQKGAVSGPNYVITDKMGSQAGSNLFHSFQTFNINTGESGTFTGPNSVQNVIGRVTGGASSMIDGRLGCSIPGANLFLINPYGMMFGPNATLDVNGSLSCEYGRLSSSGGCRAV